MPDDCATPELWRKEMPETPLEKWLAEVGARIEIPSLMREDAPRLLGLLTEAVGLLGWMEYKNGGQSCEKHKWHQDWENDTCSDCVQDANDFLAQEPGEGE